MPVKVAIGLPFKGHEKTRCLRYPNLGTFHPTKYLRGLVRCIEQRGGKLFADTAVMSVEEEDGAVVVTTEGGQKVRAKHARAVAADIGDGAIGCDAVGAACLLAPLFLAVVNR